MTFLLDHDVPADTVRLLQREGHEVRRSVEVLPRDAADAAILDWATQRGTVVITCNRNHYLELAETNKHAGIIVLIRRRTRQAELAHLLALLRRAGESGIQGNINFA